MEEKHEGKVEIKKRMKEVALFQAAYNMFTTKGVHNTSIDDIVKEAGVAKGTFYLYFKDKYDIIDKLVLEKSYKVVSEGVKKIHEKQANSFEEKLVIFIEYIIDYFKEDTLMLKLINKNFSWGLFRRTLYSNKDENKIDEIVNFFIDNLIDRGMDKEEAALTLFMIFELIGGVCYSAIILNEPCSIDEIKPVLLKKVQNLLL